MRNKLSLIFLLFGGILIMISATFISIKSNKAEKKETKEIKDDVKKSAKSSYMPIVYRIEDNDSKVYLIPSMSLGKTSITNIDSRVIDLIRDRELVVEYNFTELDQLDYIKKFILEEDDYLYKYLNDDFNNKLVDFSNNHSKYNYDDYIHYNIGFNYNVIDNLVYYEAGLTTDGLMNTLIEEKKNMENNKVSILETEDDRASYTNTPSVESFTKLIEDLITNFDKYKNNYSNNYSSFIKRDYEALNEYYNSIDMSNEYYKMKITDKNQEFKIDVDDYLANNKEVVIVFDMENVFGDNGLLNILSNTYDISLYE